MNILKFNNDYEKIPVNWKNTKATLLSIYPSNIEYLKKKFPQFIKKDSKIRYKQKYYKFNFNQCLILIFLHHSTGVIFSTIREYENRKIIYYKNKIGESFKLKRVQSE